MAIIRCFDNIKSTNLPFGMANIKKTDLDKICAAAKGYSAAKSAEQENISLKEENTNLKKNNSDLREENFSLTNRLAQLKQDYDDFAEAVVDEENLLRENERLWRENERIGNQVHTLSADIERLEAEVNESRAVIENKDKEISMLKTNFQHIRELFAALEEKFNKAMRFLEQHSLKEKWEQFIMPVVKHKSR